MLLLLNNISNIKKSYSLLAINFFVTPKQGQNIVLLKMKRNFGGLLRRFQVAR